MFGHFGFSYVGLIFLLMLMIASVILGIGHIGIHLQLRREVKDKV